MADWPSQDDNPWQMLADSQNCIPRAFRTATAILFLGVLRLVEMNDIFILFNMKLIDLSDHATLN